MSIGEPDADVKTTASVAVPGVRGVPILDVIYQIIRMDIGLADDFAAH